MANTIGVILLSIMLAACSQARGFDQDGAYFSSLFSERGGTCRDLRRALKAEIEDIKSAQKKTDDDFIAEQSVPTPENPPRGSARKGNETAALRDVAKRTKRAEQMNLVLEQRRCRTVNVEQALR
jgi:hypothetical protein